ncbi:CYTH domain-containing protein [Paraburkholderia eburnea]|uniref:CYTH domain-containing protein n=1 Tax=Paraburkholderia eburnea TaxID=1189126 RepID=A0A2S4LSN1_9BURK|nr:CYTH domain-containing protein [Paraburkholderia eburnea]POR45434.1 CYTH domain-containing protein [Paraburkholderia eburnea]PRZ13484.1 CYTH domain-containing protein [Paraburkholderia eburnea]
MGIEREIKLALPQDQVAAALRFFEARTGVAGHAIRLENLYFDTPELALARAKSALRLRRAPQGWLQTFKTVGQAKNGLHARHEWEIPVAGEALEVEKLLHECDEAGVSTALSAAAENLIPLFRTDFTRTLWALTHEGAQVEAAVDQGEITADVNGQTRRAPICEIELELKNAKDDGEAVLHALADELAKALPGLAPDDISKAQRGYKLREG